MKRQLKKFKPYLMRRFRGRYSQKSSELRWRKLELLVKKWTLENGGPGGWDNPMAENLTLYYILCAFYECMDRELTQDEFDELVDEVLGGKFRVLKFINTNKFYNNKTLMKIFHKVVDYYSVKAVKLRDKGGNAFIFKANPGGHDVGFSMTIYSCPLFEFAQKYGYLDILSWMCATDQKIAEAMNAHLIRHKTLSSGDNCCQFWYVGDKSPEALADTGSK